MKKAKRTTSPQAEEGYDIPPSIWLEVFDEPIVVQRWAVGATGSITAAAMLSHALQVSQQLGATQDGWFSRSIKEWEESVGLTRSEQETARARLVALGLFQERRVGMPAHLEFRVDQEQVYALITIQAERFAHVDKREKARAETRAKGGVTRPPRQAVPPLCPFPPAEHPGPEYPWP